MTSTADYRKLGLREDDPDGAEFDGWAKEPPAGDWGYMLDYDGIKYRRGLVAQRLRPGWWPFAYEDGEKERYYRHPLRGENVPPECGVAILRLAPDTAYQAWGYEYVLAGPDRKVPHLASATLHAWVRPQGNGGVVVRCEARFDLKARTYTLDGIGEDWPADLKAQAESKAAKVLAFLVAAMAERDNGPERPVTAYGRYQAQKRIWHERIRDYCAASGLTLDDKASGSDYYTIDGELMPVGRAAAKYMPGLMAESWAATANRS